jgi:hypothetical protein
MTLDGAKISSASLDLTHGVRASKLKIAVGIGGQITGAVLDKDGQRAVNTVAFVALVPPGSDVELDSQQGARVDDAGTYSFHGVAPSKYRLAAFGLFSIAQIANPEDAKKLAESGELIEIKSGDRITKDIKVLEPDDAKK